MASRDTLSLAPQVAEVARSLGLPATVDCAAAIEDYGERWVDEVVSEFDGEIQTMDDLLRLICDNLSVSIEYVRDDDDIDRLAKKHGGWPLDLVLRAEFLNGDTEGYLTQTPGWRPGDRRCVAFIDARGGRAYRAYFTAWHEVAHLILDGPDGPAEPHRRTLPNKRGKDPLEVLVDRVAGRIGFYGPIWRLALETAATEVGEWGIRSILLAKENAAPLASDKATLLAAVRNAPVRCCYVEAGLDYSKAQKKQMRQAEQPSLFGAAFTANVPIQIPALRLKRVVPGALGSKLRLFKKFRVPIKSVLAEASVEGFEPREADEDMSWWETSSKGHLAPQPVRVHAVNRGGVVYGLIVER